MCHLIIHQLLDLFSFIRAYIVAPMGIGQTDLLKYGDWAGKHCLSMPDTKITIILSLTFLQL